MTDAAPSASPASATAAQARAKRLETWAWICIYAGGLLLMLGLFLPAAHQSAVNVLYALGVSLAALGVALIWWRSRLPP